MRLGHVDDAAIAQELWRRLELLEVGRDQKARREPFGGMHVTALRTGAFSLGAQPFAASDEDLAREVYRRVKRTGGPLGPLMVCISQKLVPSPVARRWGVDGHESLVA